MKTTDHFVLFWGNDDIYSNFYPARFAHEGRNFNCSEQFFMFSKAMFFGDTEIADKILKETVPYEQKKLGRKVRGFDEKTWNKHCVAYMEQACYLKFAKNAALRAQLLATGNRVLVEASPYDKIWGIGLRETDPRATQPAQWNGQNLLGKVLMSVRLRLQTELQPAVPAP